MNKPSKTFRDVPREQATAVALHDTPAAHLADEEVFDSVGAWAWRVVNWVLDFGAGPLSCGGG